MRVVIKFYIIMRGLRSSETTTTPNIEGFYFAVHPVSAEFQREYSHNYYLYFEKNLQILGRYQMSPKSLNKTQRFYFQMPNAIQHFKLVSQKNLQFKWSLYIQRFTDNYQHEEHMESKKANLKWCWTVYEQHKVTANIVQVIFGVVKLKFNYLFIIGQNHQDILKSLQNYYYRNNIIPSKYKFRQQAQQSSGKKDQSHQLHQQSYIQLNQLNKSGQFQQLASETYPIQFNNLMKAQSKGQEGSSGKKENLKTISKLNKKSSSGPQISSFIKDQQLFLKAVPDISRIKHNFSVSELEISKDIQRQVREKQERLGQVQVQQQSQRSQFQNQDQNVFYSKKMDSYSKMPKAITSSQFFNERGQIVVTPFYGHIKYWFIIAAIIFIFAGLLYLRPKPRKLIVSHHHHHHQKHDNKKPHKKGHPQPKKAKKHKK